jgi:hypothetical protein
MHHRRDIAYRHRYIVDTSNVPSPDSFIDIVLISDRERLMYR